MASLGDGEKVYLFLEAFLLTVALTVEMGAAAVPAEAGECQPSLSLDTKPLDAKINLRTPP